MHLYVVLYVHDAVNTFDFAKTEEQVSVAKQLNVADFHRMMRVAATEVSKVESKEHEPTEALSIQAPRTVPHATTEQQLATTRTPHPAYWGTRLRKQPRPQQRPDES